MGDRGNIQISQPGVQPLFLYTHWGGSEVCETLARALDKDAGRGRWGDPPYLTRIIFDEMIGSDQGEETGFGISVNRQCDNEHYIPEVKWDDSREIRIIYTGRDYSAEEFIAEFKNGGK